MSKTEAIRFLNNYKASRELMESVERIFDSNPDAPETDLWIMAAEQNGYEFTPEELLAAFSERSQPAVCASLDEKELLAVAGGSRDDCHADFWCPELNYYTAADKHDSCSDSFIDKENCWHDDGCDTAYNIYDDYECKGTGNCEIAFIHR
jgi:hypothetical protein